MRESAITIMGMNVLVTGYGRIAKVIAQYLRALGANVSVCARKLSDLAWIKITGYSAIALSDMDDFLGDFDAVVNTVPARIFDRKKLLKLKKDCLVVDLASQTGIADMELAKSVGVKVIWALSLPSNITVGNALNKRLRLRLNRLPVSL